MINVPYALFKIAYLLSRYVEISLLNLTVISGIKNFNSCLYCGSHKSIFRTSFFHTNFILCRACIIEVDGNWDKSISAITRPDTRPIPVADGWAGAEMRVFPLFDSITTDQPTNRRTDKASYRAGSPRLKTAHNPKRLRRDGPIDMARS